MPVRPEGRDLVVPGSQHGFPECPAAFLRTADLVFRLRVRRGVEPFAGHLIGGQVHPAIRIQPLAHEVEVGSRTMDSMTVKAQRLVRLWLSEKASREAYEDELRDQERQAHAGGR